MKKRLLLTLLAITLALLMVAGCSQPSAGSSQPQSSQSQPEPAASTPESSEPEPPAEPINRYDEIMDTSGDADKLTVRFFQTKSNSDVKSGDSSVITFPDGKVMLVDASSPECAQTVIDNLKAMGVTKLDAVLNSHPHIDHLGGMAAVLEAFPVDHVYRNEIEYDSNAYRNFVSAYTSKDIPVTILKEGDEFDFGGAHFKIYNPEPEIEYPKDAATNTQFYNNTSIAMRISYGESSVFMAGDMYTPGEQRIIEKYGDEIQSDIAKANHHGDDSSNMRSYIDVLKPKYVVAMHDNIASLDVYNSYRKRDAEMFVTPADGCVKIQGDKEGNYTVLTQYDRPANSILK